MFRSTLRQQLLGLISLMLLMGMAVSNAATAPTEIEYAYPDQSVWTTQVDENGILKNPLLDFAERLFSRAGIPWHSTPYPAKRLFSNLKQGVSNFSMLVRAASLESCCLFSQQPVTHTELRVYRLADAAPITDKEALKGKRVITIHGYSYGGLGRFIRDPANNIEIINTPRHESAFAMLAHQRADYLLDYTGPSMEVLAAEPIPGIENHILTTLNVYLVLHKDYPDAEQVMKKLDAIAQELNREQ
ncbi:substrate-binding periplasmic protein [Sedimenticola sp.]|uniref:substrate-binding periplasmic protein n=1 Tax=Sedimenticola sp. TaxID=1940285 RepID=UPI003D1472C8